MKRATIGLIGVGAAAFSFAVWSAQAQAADGEPASPDKASAGPDRASAGPDRASAGPEGASSAAVLFDKLDRNGDGQLSADEVPQDRRNLFDRLVQTSDADKDGKLSRSEFAAGIESKRPARQLTEKLPEAYAGGGAGIDPDKIFGRFDANRDGKIVAAEVPDEGRGIFERLLARADKNGDGELTKQELVDAVNLLKPAAAGKPGQMDPARIFDNLDANSDGKLSADEIPDGRPMLQALLKRGDRDGDGSLSREEFMTGFAALRAGQPGQGGGQPGQKPNPSAPDRPQPDAGKLRQRLTQRFAQMDADHDGKVSRQEFDARQQARFAKLDTNGDGYLEPSEIEARAAALVQKAATRGQAARKAPGDAPGTQNPAAESNSK